ncbi:hypothetical protein JL721_6084 [Aureococcus anophagefferens]|nr:hypothetical protein JL721_6084 [Aureococcus anophagefferens]
MGKGRLGLGRVAPAPTSVCYALPCAGGDGELGGRARSSTSSQSFGAGNRRLGVPDAIVVPARCYRAVVASPAIAALLRTAAAADDPAESEAALALRRRALRPARRPAEGNRGLRGAPRVARRRLPVVGVLRDALDASYAGQFETVLNCASAAACEDGVRKSGRRRWPRASWPTPVARRGSLFLKAVAMAVVLQRQIADALGRGADVEFAVEASKRFGGRKLWLLQARAVTATMDGPASVGPWRGANDGTWERDAHATRPVPPMNDFFGDVLADEVTRAQIKYGLGLAKLRCDLVNGIPYLQPVPLGAPDPPPVGPPPPGPVLAALSAALRKTTAARRTLKCRGWMADIRAWKDTERAAREAAARALGAVDPGSSATATC